MPARSLAFGPRRFTQVLSFSTSTQSNRSIFALRTKLSTTRPLPTITWASMATSAFPISLQPPPINLHPDPSHAFLIRYGHEHKGYCCYGISSLRFYVSHHVTFDEQIFPFATSTNNDSENYSFLLNPISQPPPPGVIAHHHLTSITMLICMPHRVPTPRPAPPTPAHLAPTIPLSAHLRARLLLLTRIRP
jgi:hypothetical protein